ncbi:MAG TPA: LacI family DNA-binding transcriptional regulator [Chthoniobacterales bacterium]
MPNPRNITITEVARAAKVSIQTVSAVLNDKPGISEPTRVRIRRIVARLNYHPNGLASSLRARRSQTVGVVIPTITNPFFPEFVRGAEDAAHRNGYSLFLCNSDEDCAKEIQYLQLLRRHRAAGFLVVSVSENAEADRLLAELAAAKTPVVTMGPRRAHPDVVAVEIDDAEIARLATAHLAGLGHRRIAFITPPPSKGICAARITGYGQALKEARITRRYLVEGGFGFVDGIHGAQTLMASLKPPTAIVAANDLAAIGAISALKRLRFRVPGDVSVVGIDDIQMAAFIDPPLTTVAQPVYEMGRQAMEAILARVADPSLPGATLSFNADLKIRQSTAPPSEAVP